MVEPISFPAAPPVPPAPYYRNASAPRQPLSWMGTMMAIACGIIMSGVIMFVGFVIFWGAIFSSIAGTFHSTTN
jgi:hypothetical protein